MFTRVKQAARKIRKAIGQKVFDTVATIKNGMKDPMLLAMVLAATVGIINCCVTLYPCMTELLGWNKMLSAFVATYAGLTINLLLKEFMGTDPRNTAGVWLWSGLLYIAIQIISWYSNILPQDIAAGIGWGIAIYTVVARFASVVHIGISLNAWMISVQKAKADARKVLAATRGYAWCARPLDTYESYSISCDATDALSARSRKESQLRMYIKRQSDYLACA